MQRINAEKKFCLKLHEKATITQCQINLAPVAEFIRHGDIVTEKKLSFAERFVHKVKNFFFNLV